MRNKLWRNFDFLLLFITLALIGYGLAMIYSATLNNETGGLMQSLVFRQGIIALVGFILFAVVISFDYQLLGSMAAALYVFGLGLMAFVLVLGTMTHGATRWIDLGFTTVEPSEFAKLILIIVLAKFFSDHEEDMHKFKTVLLSALLVAPFIVLTMLQPHLGNSIVYLVIWFVMVIMAGLRFAHAAVIAGVGLVVAPIGWVFLNTYMHERVATFLDPTSDPLDKGYNVIQALISVGAGGLTGRGFLSGTQSQLQFLRVQYADFIFSVLAEELGFIGVMLLFALFVGLLLRGVRTAALAYDTFGRLLATGVVAMITFEVFVNVGINTRMLPVTGLPLPFLSYGGSALVALLIAIGILESVAMRRAKAEF